MPKIVEVPGYGDVEFPDSMDEASITKVVANQYRENEFAKSLTKGQTATALPDGKISKDMTQMPPEALGRGQRDLAEDLGRAGRRGIARPLVGALKTANDVFGAGLKGTEQNLEKWIGDQGNMSDWTRAVGGGVGQLPWLAMGLPGILSSAAGGAADTRADLKREGATELAASGVAATDALSTILAGKFLNSTKPFKSAVQNVGQEYVTGKAQKYILDNSMTPELADRFDPTAPQLVMAGAMGAGLPALKRQQAKIDALRNGPMPKGARQSVMDSAKEQIDQAKNLEQGFTADGTGIVLKEPILNKGQTAIANKLSLGDEVTNATNDIDAQRIQAPQFGSEKPRFVQSLEDFGASQDARIKAADIDERFNRMTEEQKAEWVKTGKFPYEGDPTKAALLQGSSKPTTAESHPNKQVAALLRAPEADAMVADNPNFDSWFKDSKVVDNSGKPLVVYHGTNKTEGGEAFRSFDTYGSNYGLMGMGSYFTTDADVASDYTRKGKGDSPTVYPVYLNIKNPIDMDGPADVEAWKRAFPDAEAYHDGGKTNESWFRAAEESLMDQQIPHYEGAEMMQESLRGMGFDGITHMGGNRVGTKPHRVFIAFDPEQIKSATGNRGTYDPNNPDINANNAPKGWGKVETGVEDVESALQKLVQQSIERVRASLTKDNVFAAIDAVRNATVNENYKAILDRVKGVLENMESQGIKINYNLDENNDVQVDGQGVRGYHKSTPGKQIEIGLNKALGGADNYEVFTHELVHSVAVPLSQRVAYAIATKDVNFLNKNRELVAAHKDLQNLFKQLKGKERGEFVPPQALKNMQELMAYGMTNRATIDWLKSQTVNGTNGLMAFVKAVGKFLGFKETDVNAHTQLWHTFDRMAGAGKTADFTYNGKGKSSDIRILDNIYAAAEETKKKPVSTESGQVLLRLPGLENAAGNRVKDLPVLMKGTVDVKPTVILDTFRPGMRNKAWMTKHPLLQVVNNEVAQAKARANTFLEKYVTGKEGFARLATKMTDSELAEVNSIYVMASKQKVRLDPSKVEGLSEVQKTYLNRIYNALDARWANANRLREAAGLPKIPYRQGYYPGILDADFASVGVDKEGMVVAIAGDNTKWAYNKAKNWLKKQEGVVEVVEIKNGKSTNNFRQNDVLSGLLKLLQIMPADDAATPKIKALKEQIELMTNDQLFGMYLHRLPKKGITGFTGDRPWLSPEQNAREFNKGLINFFSKAAVADELHVPIKQMKEAFNTFGKDHPNAVEAATRWLGQVAGSHGNTDLSEIGRGLNALVYGIGRMAGLGPSKVRSGLGLGADIATQHVLGWYNTQFLGSNFVQVLQGGVPFAMWAAEKLEMSPYKAGEAWALGMFKGSLLLGEYVAPGQKIKVPLNDFDRKAWNYAQKMGILQFSEIERLHAESQGKWKQRYDTVAEMSMKMGEVGTRPLVFMAMANLLKNSKYGSQVSDDVLLEHAYNITQFAMADYNPEQRPLLYSELGIVGQMLGKFATYKHNFVGQEAFFAKESKNNPMPFLAMNGMLFALAGAMGMPAMEEILWLLEKATGENYKEKLLKNMNLVGAYGVLSEKLGVNVSSKFSAGNILPDDMLNTVPSISILTKAMQTVLDAGGKAAEGTFTSQDAKNVGRALLPSSMQREFDRQMNRGPNNELIGKEGDTRDYLSDEEWDTRKFFGWQGTALSEAARSAVDRESFRTNTTNEERIRGSLDSTARMMNQGELSQKAFEKQMEKYVKAGGDPDKFADEIRRRVSVLKQPLWFRRMRKNGDEVAPTPGNARILDNPYRQQ